MAQSQLLPIDNAETTVIKYLDKPNESRWAQMGKTVLSLDFNGTAMPINATPCYDQTYTYAACATFDNCQLQIPFNGSGITIYVYQASPQGVNASFQIDDGDSSVNVVDKASAPNYSTPNVSMFNVQSLPSGNHTLTLTLLDWTDTFSGMMFDYAVVNQSFVTPSPTTPSSVTTSATHSTASTGTTNDPNSPKSSDSSIGTIISGVVAGVAVVIALVFAVFYFRGRNRRSGIKPLDVVPYTLTPFDPASNNIAFQKAPVTINPPAESASTPFLSSTSPLSSPPASNTAQAMAIVDPSINVLTSSGPNMISEMPRPSSPPRPTHDLASSPLEMRENPFLTDEQADFVHSLHSNNVPVPAIARVMQRMIADRGPHARATTSSTRLTGDFSPQSSMAPPGYYEVC